MGYKALVTIDLSNATKESREKFYRILTEEKWIKIKTLTTSWNVLFNDKVSRENAINIIINDLRKAKRFSGVSRVDYAIQLDIQDIEINYL